MKKPSIDNVNDRIRFVILKYKKKKTIIDKLHLKLLKRYYPNNDIYEREIAIFLIYHNYLEDLNGGGSFKDEETGETIEKPNYIPNYVATPNSRPAYKSKLFHPSEWIEWFFSKTLVRTVFITSSLYGLFRAVMDLISITLYDVFHKLFDFI